jgi:hypothetical protein
MSSPDAALRRAATMMAGCLHNFRRIAEQAREQETRVNLAPSEMWEAADQIALDAYETALMQINGARPLPME